MDSVKWLRKNLTEVFSLPADAVDWLIMLFDIIQVFDDVADGDEVLRGDLNPVIWNSLVGMYSNPFFARNITHLIPVVSLQILKWQASDTVERDGKACAMSFVWRAGYYDIVLAVVQLVHGHKIATENAHHVMELYGEKYEDYLEEFNNA